MKPKLIIYWCRRDFRLSDNSALTAAIEYSCQNQIPLLPIFILDSNILKYTEPKEFTKKNASLSTNLDSSEIIKTANLDKTETEENNPKKILREKTDNFNLQNTEESKNNSKSNNPNDNSSQKIGSLANNSQNKIKPNFHPNIGFPRRLFLSRVLADFSIGFPVFEILIGDYQEIFKKLNQTFELCVFANSDVEPFSRFRDRQVDEILLNKFQTFADQLTVSPEVRTQTGQIYSIFTPFKNATLESFLNAVVLPKVNLNLAIFPTYSKSQNSTNSEKISNFSEKSHNNSDNFKKAFDQNLDAGLDILKLFYGLFPDFGSQSNIKQIVETKNPTQNNFQKNLEENAQITKKIEINLENQNTIDPNVPKPNSNLQSDFIALPKFQVAQSFRLDKKSTFEELQSQIFQIIDTDWTFRILRHSPKNTVSSSDNSQFTKENQSSTSQDELFANLGHQEQSVAPNSPKLKERIETNQENNSETSEIFEESSNKNDNLEINLDQILNRPDFLEWKWTEAEILADFDNFLETKILNYKEKRDSLALDTVDSGQTSKVSFALKWGLVSARTLKQKIVGRFGLRTQSESGIVHFISELMWREFYRYVIFHEPLVLDLEFQNRFRPKIAKIPQIAAKLTAVNIAKILKL